MLSSEHIEIENIYNAIMRIGYRSVAICSANSGEGCTTVVSHLAQRFLLAGHRTLVVDFNLYRSNFVLALDFKTPDTLNSIDTQHTEIHRQLPVHLISPRDQQLALNGILAPEERNTVIRLCGTQALAGQIARWQKEYEIILFDTSPLSRKNSQNIPSHLVAAACEATLLVVLAAKTREIELADAVKQLTDAQANLIGSIINDKLNPSLKNELLRETARLRPRFGKLATYLQRKLQQYSFLSIDQ